MLSLRNRFGIPGVISVIALVFALVAGTAYAADSSADGASASAKKNNRAKKNRKGNAGLNGKQKRQVIALAKRFASAGPAGPQGVPGLPGASGAKGADGDDGSDGSNGESVAVSDEGPGANCPLGGSKFEAGSDTAYACDGLPGPQGNPGVDGDPWTANGTLPTGATLTGTYVTTEEAKTTAGTMPEGTEAFVPASFALPVVPVPSFTFVPHDSVTFGFGADEENGCPGVVDGVPQADPGKFCVYGISTLVFNPALSSPAATVVARKPTAASNTTQGASPTGAVLQLTCGDDVVGDACQGRGVWAVTGDSLAP